MVKTKLQLRVTRHFISDRPEEKEDILVDEHPFSIILDGKKRFEGVITPGRFREFAVGFLFTRGLIRGMGDLECLEIEEDRVVAKSCSKNGPGPEREKDEKALLIPGVRGRDDSVPVGPVESDLIVHAGTVFSGIDELSRMPLYRETGATHSAILFDTITGAEIRSEDIARHNALDKSIGGGIVSGLDMTRCWLALSGRLPQDMVLKAAKAGIPLVASISAATAAGVSVAKKAGITLIGFCRQGGFTCYCHDERISQPGEGR